MIRAAVLFFFSGALALVYEVLWQRRFALLFGGGARAATLVLAACFAGMGAGSLVVGRRARGTRPLRAYAVLEVLVAAGALASIPLSSAAATLRAAVMARTDSAALRVPVEAILALAALAVPTFAMGGTLPVLARLADGAPRRLGLTAGLLYAANTVGAAVGAIGVPLVLLPALGGRGSLGAAALGSVIVAAAAWSMDRRTADGPAATGSDVVSPPAWTEAPVVLAAVSGLATLALQVSWTRAFAQVHENSTQSFALIVALFVLALAAGAQAARTLLARGREPIAIIGAAWGLAAILAASGPMVFVRLTGGMEYLPRDESWMASASRLAVVASVVLLPTVAAMGVAFPAILEWAGRGRPSPTGEVVGRVLAANVAGCVAGALLAGFVLPQWIGTWRGMLLVAALLLGAGAWCLGRSATRGRRVLVAVGLVALAAAGLADLPRVRVARAQGEQLLAVAEGADGIVAVVERPGSRRLKLNNHYVLGGSASLGDERMQAHLPMLLHPAPRRVAVLGLGTGITAGGVLFHPFERLTAVELVPEVSGAARAHFAAENGGVLDDPRTDVVVADARAFLRGTDARFDVIVGDLAVPWRPGESVLFTREHFEAARAALAPGGLFCQWLPLFQLTRPQLELVMRTLLSVFPEAQLWRGDFSADEPALALVASVTPAAPDPARVAAALRSMTPDPANPHLADPSGVWMYFAGIVRTADLPRDDERLNREDSPWLELRGPWAAAREGRVTGRRLPAWLAQVDGRDEARLAALGPHERAAMEAGEQLFEFSLALGERDDAAARRAQERLRVLLPPAAYAAFFPGP